MIPSLFVAPGAAWASGEMVAVMIFSVVYFVVLIVVAFEPHERTG